MKSITLAVLIAVVSTYHIPASSLIQTDPPAAEEPKADGAKNSTAKPKPKPLDNSTKATTAKDSAKAIAKSKKIEAELTTNHKSAMDRAERRKDAAWEAVLKPK